jgi:hypothetical protein
MHEAPQTPSTNGPGAGASKPSHRFKSGLRPGVGLRRRGRAGGRLAEDAADSNRGSKPGVGLRRRGRAGGRLAAKPPIQIGAQNPASAYADAVPAGGRLAEDAADSNRGSKPGVGLRRRGRAGGGWWKTPPIQIGAHARRRPAPTPSPQGDGWRRSRLLGGGFNRSGTKGRRRDFLSSLVAVLLKLQFQPLRHEGATEGPPPGQGFEEAFL